MKQSTKKKLKKAVWYVPATVCLAASICSVYKCSQASKEYWKYNTTRNQIYDKVMQSEEFQRYEDDYKQAIYNAYKSGAITAEEYSDKLTGVTSYKQVWRNRDKYMSAEDEQNIMSAQESINEANGKRSIFSALCVVEFAGAVSFAHVGGLLKEEDMTM